MDCLSHPIKHSPLSRGNFTRKHPFKPSDAFHKLIDGTFDAIENLAQGAAERQTYWMGGATSALQLPPPVRHSVMLPM